MANATTAVKLLRFWLISSSNSARIELSDGLQLLCTLKRNGDVTSECPEDDARMLALAIEQGETLDDRFEGWDRDESAAWSSIEASEREWAAKRPEAA